MVENTIVAFEHFDQLLNRIRQSTTAAPESSRLA
jgi:hypothetical protein